MPTENRSSNTDMISVPRDLAEEICNGLRITQERGVKELRAILAQPVEQHQGDAIGTLVRDYNERIVFTPIGDPHIIDDMKVYAHADPGEVERLRSMFDQTNAELRSVTADRDTLRAQLVELKEAFNESQEEVVKRGKKLAERDALLSSAYSDMERANKRVGQCISCGEPPEDDGIITHDQACAFCAMEMATYASAESNATANSDERADILADAAYRNGVMHGYKLAMEGSEAEYQACINNLTGHLHAARAALSASAEPTQEGAQ